MFTFHSVDFSLQFKRFFAGRRHVWNRRKIVLGSTRLARPNFLIHGIEIQTFGLAPELVIYPRFTHQLSTFSILNAKDSSTLCDARSDMASTTTRKKLGRCAESGWRYVTSRMPHDWCNGESSCLKLLHRRCMSAAACDTRSSSHCTSNSSCHVRQARLFVNECTFVFDFALAFLLR